MKRMKIETNKGKIFDWFLNHYLNFILWMRGIYDNEEEAVKITAMEINKIKKLFHWI